ncbi:hypothetical protein [Salinibacter altiplanensis]|uniref:hypothetical protein n=1 Tax=Salinibacter altiplanensis TaxID=1803181 RepID=UPI000C9FB77E|nr:hypothetical protein [Salinibacter altiplanensis]
MSRVPYDLKIEGLHGETGTITASQLRDLLAALVDAAGRSLRLSIEGTSSVRGPRPQWLEDATTFIVTGLEEGSTTLPMNAPRLGEAAGDVINQRDMWEDRPDPSETSLALLAKVLDAIKQNDRTSDEYDRGVLKAVSEFGDVIQNGESVSVINRETGKPTFEVTHTHVRNARKLKDDTPPTQMVVLSGHLTAIKARPRAFKLQTQDGKAVRGKVRASGIKAEQLRDLWNRKVTVEGEAHFTPAETLRFIDARTLRQFTDRDRLFEKSKEEVENEATRQRPISSRRQRSTDASSGLQAFRGSWPGDESIGTLLEALD